MKRNRKLLTVVFTSILMAALLFSNPQSASAEVFSDNFSSLSLNPAFWRIVETGSGVQQKQTGGHLEMQFSPDAAEGPNGVFMTEAASTCKLRGDFDMQVDFFLLDWSEENGVRVGLTVSDAGADSVTLGALERVSLGQGEFGAFPRESYLTHFSTAGINGLIETNDTLGTLRLVRTGGYLIAYYLKDGSWTYISDAPVSGGDVGYAIAAWSHNNSFADKAVTIAFDNFIVNSGEMICDTSSITPTSIPTPTPTPTPSVILFKQDDPQWADKQYAYETGRCATIAQCGCALTSIAMVLNHHGATKDPNGNPTTPETVNEYFKRNSICGERGCASLGYAYGNVLWQAAGKYSEEAYSKFGTQKIVWNGKSDYDPQVVTSDLHDNNPAILKVLPNSHWAVATGIDGNTFTLNDPVFNRTKLSDNPYNNNAYMVERYQKTNSDFSSFEVVAKSPAQILITDPNGKQTGYDQTTKLTKRDIPNSYYYFDSAISDATGKYPTPAPDEGVYIATITTPQKGNYNVKIISPQNKLYSFAVYGSDRNAGLIYDLFEAAPSTAAPHEYQFGYSPNSGETQFAQKVKIDVKPGMSPNILVCKNNQEMIPVILFGSETFDVNKVDLKTVVFEGAKIFSVGSQDNKKLLLVTTDFNNDKYKDVLLFFRSSDATLSCLATSVKLQGELTSGRVFEGEDMIKMIK